MIPGRENILFNTGATEPGEDGKPVPILITRGQVKDFVNEEFFEAYSMFYMWKTFGLPNGNIGWANEPATFIDAMTILDSELNAIEKEEMEKD